MTDIGTEMRHALSDADLSPLRPDELYELAASIEQSLIDNECNFSH